MGLQTHDRYSRPEKGDLEGGGPLVATGEGGFLRACYPYVFERDLCISWKLFGCCILAGLMNIFSTCFTLGVTTNLAVSDIVFQANSLLLSSGVFVSLFWRLHVLRCQSMRERYGTINGLFARVESGMVGCLLTIMLSPTVTCLPLLVIFLSFGNGAIPYDTPGVPLVVSWFTINIVATIVVPSFILRQKNLEQGCSTRGRVSLHEGIEDYDSCRNFDETDGPTFLPQQPIPAYHDIFGRFPSEGLKTALALTPETSWENTIETPEAFGKMVRWAIAAPEESLGPSVVAEVFAIAAISIGVCLDGMSDWNQDAQYTYLVSRTCDRLAEIFQQADPSSVPEQAMNVFLFVHRFEQFDVDVVVPGSDRDYISAEELKGIVRCLKSKSAHLLGG